MRAVRAALLAACLTTGGAGAAPPDPVTLMLSSARQAQFAGYYVAAARGLYAAAGLDVTIVPGPADGDSTPPHPTTRTGTVVWSAWLPQALAARATGLNLVNIAQIFLHSGLALVCRKQSAIHSPADLKGKTIGVWFDGAQIPFFAWMARLGLKLPGDVTVLPTRRAPADAAVAPLLDRDAACVTILNYVHYWRLIDAGMQPKDLVVFHYGDAGTATLQDGLYATQHAVSDPRTQAVLVRFVQASLAGWQYALGHQPQAVRDVAGAHASPAELLAQTRMMSVVARLVRSGLQPMGYLEPAAYDRTVQLLVHEGALAAPPAVAWSHAIWAAPHGPGRPPMLPPD